MSAGTEERDEIRRAFDGAVNMAPAELERWLERTESRQVGWGEIHGNATGGKLEPAVGNRCPHALFAFPDYRGGKPDDRESGQAGAETHFDMHEGSLQPYLCATGNGREGDCRYRHSLAPGRQCASGAGPPVGGAASRIR